MTSRILRTGDAARYCGLARRTLEKLRACGEGPQPIKLGVRAIGYDIRALDRWLDERVNGTMDKSSKTTPFGGKGVSRER